MLKSFKKVLKNKRGQIGEILVVVILIILAVLGIVRYVMPMFDKSKGLSDSAGGQVDQLSSTAKGAQFGNVGDIVPGQTVINAINYNAEVAKMAQTTKPYVTVNWQSRNSAGILQTQQTFIGSATNTYYQETTYSMDLKVDRAGNYMITATTLYADDSLNTITYVEQ